LSGRERRLEFKHPAAAAVGDPKIAGTVESDIRGIAQSVLRHVARSVDVRKIGVAKLDVSVLSVAESRLAMYEPEHP
jgi:hypothetical protein